MLLEGTSVLIGCAARLLLLCSRNQLPSIKGYSEQSCFSGLYDEELSSSGTAPRAISASQAINLEGLFS